jgi:hypothetical protein
MQIWFKCKYDLNANMIAKCKYDLNANMMQIWFNVNMI